MRSQLSNKVKKSITHALTIPPSFVVGSELFWGNARLEIAISWASRSCAGFFGLT
jgi:2-hydroxychromene-2-carboxylate isomerase